MERGDRSVSITVEERLVPPLVKLTVFPHSLYHPVTVKASQFVQIPSRVQTVLFNLLLCLVIFYCLFYMIGSVCFGAFRLDHFDGLIPFDFKTEPAESNSKYLVNLLSLELTYFCSGILFAAVVRRRVWDYALTVTLLHVLITSLVMLEFPMVWQWWLALGSGLFLMICNGQLIAYFTCQSDQTYASFSIY